MIGAGNQQKYIMKIIHRKSFLYILTFLLIFNVGFVSETSRIVVLIHSRVQTQHRAAVSAKERSTVLAVCKMKLSEISICVDARNATRAMCQGGNAPLEQLSFTQSYLQQLPKHLTLLRCLRSM